MQEFDGQDSSYDAEPEMSAFSDTIEPDAAQNYSTGGKHKSLKAASQDNDGSASTVKAVGTGTSICFHITSIICCLISIFIWPFEIIPAVLCFLVVSEVAGKASGACLVFSVIDMIITVIVFILYLLIFIAIVLFTLGLGIIFFFLLIPYIIVILACFVAITGDTVALFNK